MPDIQLNFEPRYYVGYYVNDPVGGPGLVAVDDASDQADAANRADWYAKRDPDHTYTTYIIVDVEASRELDAWLKDHRGAYSAASGAASRERLFSFDFDDKERTPNFSPRPHRPRGGRR